MLKKIQFKLTKIKYTGKSIGDDISVNIELLNTSLRIDRRIAVGKTIEFSEEIGSFPSDQKSFTAKAKITVMEKDALFNDANNDELAIKVDVNNTKPQNFSCLIELHENRFGKTWGESVAKFEITVKALVKDMIKYIPDIDNGWLKVKILDGDTVSLPAFLKVRSEYYENDREYFTILEGAYKNKKASVSLNNGNSRLVADIQHESSIRLQYSISKKALFIGNKKYKTTDSAESPWKKGWYDIELPDFPHPGGLYYEDRSSRAKTWFRIGHEGERYLHTGRASLGCITIIEVEKWNEVYDKLVKARKGDFLSVGVLEVVS